MDYLLELLLLVLAGMLVISTFWLAVLQRHRVRERMLASQLAMARRELEEYELWAIEALSMAHRHLPLGRRPEIVREALPAMDRAMQEWQSELKELHRRLVVNLHVINQLRKSEEQLSGRVIELEQMLMESSEYELRARFRAVTSERDYFRNQLIELQQLVAPDKGTLATDLSTMGRHNEVLRQELKQARRLIQVMQRQVRLLHREGMEGAGIAVRGLMQHDLEPGAFESLSDLPTDDPEEFADEELSSYGDYRPTPLPIPIAPSQQVPLDLPMPVPPADPEWTWDPEIGEE